MGKNWDMPEGASSFLPGIIKLDFSSNLAYMHISSLLSAVYENIHKAQEQKLNWSSQCETTAVSNPSTKDEHDCETNSSLGHTPH